MEAHHQSVIDTLKARGMCGNLIRGGTHVCIREAGHDDPCEENEFVIRAQKMLAAHPVFDVPKNEWAEVCRGLLDLLSTRRSGN